MSSPEKKSSYTIGTLIIDLVITGIVFAIFYWLVHPHVPSTDPKMIMLWGGLTAGCMAGVFWLAWQMFKVVFAFQRAQKK